MNPLSFAHTTGFALGALARSRLGRRHMERYQLRKLRQLLTSATANQPFYRDWFQSHGVDPRDIRQLSDFRSIPPMGKQQLREFRDSFTQEEIDRRGLIEHKTSGSTGVPMSFLRTTAEERRLNLLRWRLQWMLGLRPGDRLAKVKTTWEPLSVEFNRPQGLLRAIGLLDTRIFDCFNQAEENYHAIVRFQPHVLSGYPSALAMIALQHQQQQLPLRCLRRVSVGGETLAPFQRRILEESFGLPVTDVYGTSECNLVAWQCGETGLYHVNDDGVLLEVCRDGVPVAEGESGELLVTSLHSRAMPIIRYRIGDLAVAGPSPDPSGAPFSTLKELRGRTIDYLQWPDGRELHPFEVMNEVVIHASDWICEYQIVQETPEHLRFDIVPLRAVSDTERTRMLAAIQKKVGDKVRVRLEFADRISRNAGGKLHFCRTEQAATQRTASTSP